MAETMEKAQASTAVYSLQGTLTEVCSCGVLCPCWVGADPDGGECYGVLGHNIAAGQIEGVDVSGLSIVLIAHIPGNVFAGGWRVAVFVDEKADERQKAALLRAFTGELGGPMADLAALVGEVVAVEDVAIHHGIEDGKGMLRIDGILDAEVEPFKAPDGTTTTLRDSVFSTVPGSPAYVGRALRNRVTLPQHGMEWSYEDSNAIQADWTMEHSG